MLINLHLPLVLVLVVLLPNLRDFGGTISHKRFGKEQDSSGSITLMSTKYELFNSAPLLPCDFTRCDVRAFLVYLLVTAPYSKGNMIIKLFSKTF